jgi:hypothetical protein
MVKKIFWRENYGKDKKLKSRIMVPLGERENLKSDKNKNSKYNRFTKNTQVINSLLAIFLL